MITIFAVPCMTMNNKSKKVMTEKEKDILQKFHEYDQEMKERCTNHMRKKIKDNSVYFVIIPHGHHPWSPSQRNLTEKDLKNHSISKVGRNKYKLIPIQKNKKLKEKNKSTLLEKEILIKKLKAIWNSIPDSNPNKKKLENELKNKHESTWCNIFPDSNSNKKKL